MKIYLVGGAVRDGLLKRPARESDWVVVGATPEAMTAQGFRAVGKDFPVFLHPDTKEEYALARTERKTSPGYHGFVFHTAPDVTLEDDLARRDLTINAMARDEDGALIDPFNGAADIEARMLRHVSPAFAEDPVRILRVARFAARFADLDFSIAPETLALMREMVANGEVDALVPDRVWQETQRAIAEARPAVFFQVLRDCGALAKLFPEIDKLFGVPQPARYHPEIDTGIHTLMVLDQAARLSNETTVRFAALVHDLGKAETPPDILPSHHGHEARSVDLIKTMCRRLPVPKEQRELALLVAELHGKVHRVRELKPSTLLKLLEQTDALRRPERFTEFLLACEADARGRTGLEDEPYPQAAYLHEARKTIAAVNLTKEEQRKLSGQQIGERLHQQRLAALKTFVTNHKSS
ncbi:MAG: multifunctional CCA addition/repair protein [Gammaproteobacteria bacterium]|nr:multifunctional CCA addition/repair protein [Gammaproteobacteria bacterium]